MESSCQRISISLPENIALAGIVANASGFSEGLNREAAANVAAWLFLAFVPLGILGCVAALRISAPVTRQQEATR